MTRQINSDCNLTLFEVLCSRGYTSYDRFNVYVSAFRPHIRKYIECILPENVRTIDFTYILECPISAFLYQGGFSNCLLDDLCNDVIRIGSLYGVVEADFPYYFHKKAIGELLVTNSAGDGSRRLDCPPKLLLEMNASLSNPKLISFEAPYQETGVSLEHSDSLERFLIRNLWALYTICINDISANYIEDITSNAYFRLVMYRCSISGSYSDTDLLNATKRLENFYVIKCCLRLLIGNEIELSLFELGKVFLCVVGQGNLMTRFDIVKWSISNHQAYSFHSSLLQLNLHSLSDGSVEKLEWGLIYASSRSLCPIGWKAKLSLVRIEQRLRQYFGRSYFRLTSIKTDIKQTLRMRNYEKVKLIFQTETCISIELLSKELGIDGDAALSLVPQSLHRFVDIPNTTESSIDEQRSRFIANLQEAAKYEETISMDKYDRLISCGYICGPGSQSVIRVFGSWNEACDSAGVRHRGGSNRLPKKYSRQGIVEVFSEYMLNTDFSGSLSKFPEWAGNAQISSATIRKWFPTTHELYMSCREYIRSNKLNEYNRYVANAFQNADKDLIEL
jgi:hypothetical protein